MDLIKFEPEKKQLKNDLEKYLGTAKDLGANRASIVKAEDIPVKESVIIKCQVPRCFGYGTCVNCPPYALKPSELTERLKEFRWGLFFSVNVLTEVLVKTDNLNTQKRKDNFQKIYKIVSEVESRAFYDGYYLAFGFAAGSCRHILCNKEECLALDNKSCRYPLLARPSMEAVGIDVFKLAVDNGWTIYPIGKSTEHEKISKGILTGIIFIC